MRLIDADELTTTLEAEKIPFNHEINRIILGMPTISLKDYAKAEGYNLIKKNPMPKLQPCPKCGKRGGVWQSTEGYLVRCNSCDYETPLYKNEYMARDAWNWCAIERESLTQL